MDDDQNTKKTQDVTSDKSNEKPEENKKVEELKNKITELEENWKRALADYQNLSKRTDEDVANAILYGNQGLILKFLEILDHLEEAQKHLKDKGIELVIKRFSELLKNEGVSEIKSIGQIFDPKQHECVDKKTGNKDNVVIEVLRRGYMIRNRVIRPARVIVEVNN